MKDRSSMPLVSVTMQPRNLPIDEAPEPDVDDGALDDGALDEGELVLVADAHAVVNKAMAPSATAFLVTVAPTADVGVSVPAVFRCVIVDE